MFSNAVAAHLFYHLYLYYHITTSTRMQDWIYDLLLLSSLLLLELVLAWATSNSLCREP
jgi:hypothetical protein